MGVDENGEEKMQTFFGPHRVFPGRLSVSRTFGDIEAKVTSLGGNPNVVIAEPEIKAFRIKKDHDFIVLGCDGIFDKLTSREVVKLVWEAANKSKARSIHELAGESADNIMKSSIIKKTLDNITVVMIVFENFKNKLFP